MRRAAACGKPGALLAPPGGGKNTPSNYSFRLQLCGPCSIQFLARYLYPSSKALLCFIAAQILSGKSADPHRDPHGRRSGWKQRREPRQSRHGSGLNRPQKRRWPEVRIFRAVNIQIDLAFHKNNHTVRCGYFYGYQGRFYMLGGNTRKGYATSVGRQSRQRLCSESRLRQDFRRRRKNAGTAQKRRGPEGPLGGSPVNRSKLKISGLKPKGKTKGSCESSCLLFWCG